MITQAFSRKVILSSGQEGALLPDGLPEQQESALGQSWKLFWTHSSAVHGLNSTQMVQEKLPSSYGVQTLLCGVKTWELRSEITF